MKKYISIFFAALIIFYSCKRDFSLKSPTQSIDGTSLLKIIDASPNFRKIYNLPDSFNVFINGNKVTGFTPGGSGNYVLTYGALFPTVSSGYGYISIPPGTQQIKLSVAGVTNPDSIAITTLTKQLLPNMLYSLIITDSLNSPRDSSQIFVQDAFVQPTAGYFNLRFIHAVWNDTVGKNIDIWSTRTNRNIYTNVKPGTITTFTALPYNTQFNDTFFVRRSGTGTGPMITLDTLSAVSFSNQRTYTLLYRGDANSNSSANLKRRHLAVYVNQ